jgi:hypothetical protein
MYTLILTTQVPTHLLFEVLVVQAPKLKGVHSRGVCVEVQRAVLASGEDAITTCCALSRLGIPALQVSPGSNGF